MRLLPLLCLFAFCADHSSADIVVHVSPLGRNTWSGTREKPNATKTDGPVASLTGARDAVRRIRARGRTGGPVTVLVHAGRYRLTEPVVFGAQDSGTREAPVTYRAAEGAQPIFSGGRRIGPWKPAGKGLWTADVPDVRSGRWMFEQLWVNGRRATRARTPNEFWYYTAGKHEAGIDPSTGQPADLSRRAFVARPQDLASLRSLSAQDRSAAVLVAYHSWETSRHPIQSADTTTGVVVVPAPGAPWPFQSWGPSQRYHLENVRSALDAPGEWFLSRSGALYYMPRPGERMQTAEVVAPAADAFLRFEGSATAPVRHISVADLRFTHGQWIMPSTGHADGQAETSIAAAVTADFALNISLERCELSRIGTYGVWFRRGCTDCTVEQCLLQDLGAGGVRIGEGEIRPPGPDRTGRITVRNNIIHSGSQIHHGAIGVWIGQSGDNIVVHNDISDLTYTGVSVGWTWGYGESLARNNRIDYNHIHHIGKGILSDLGGVYTLGISDGTSVSNNHIHDIYSYDRYGRGGWGLYNDEGSTHITLENNLVHDVRTGTYHQHYGRENMVRNNILGFSANNQLQRSRVEPHPSFTLERNIVVWDRSDLFFGSWTDENVALSSNLYWHYKGRPVFGDKVLPEWQASGKDKGSMIADPLFVDVAKRDFRLRKESPALKLGFQPFDLGQQGVIGPVEWRRRAASLRFRPLMTAPVPPLPPPMDVDQGFESIPLGNACPDAQNNIEGKGDSIAVTDETANSGSRSLRITDATGLQFAYNPHLVFTPNYRTGRATCSFALRLSPGSVIYHEWRDWTTPEYRVGPSFWVTNGKLTIGGSERMTLPVDTWFTITVECPIGAGDAKWSMAVSVPGQETKAFADIPVGSPDFRTLTWVGFCSNAQAATTVHLDDLKLKNR